MPGQQTLRWRRPANPAAFSTLLLVVVVLGYLALTRVVDRNTDNTGVSAAQKSPPGIEFDRFSARRERSGNDERLRVSLRIRSTFAEPIRGFLFLVARNDHVSPRIWAIWPPESERLAISPGGHFHGASPSSGHALSLAADWQPIKAVLPQQSGASPYDTLIVYLVSPQAQILLSRPFAL